MKSSITSKLGHYKKKYSKIFFVLSVLFYLLLSCSLYATSITCFVNSENSTLLSSGISGLALIISRYVIPSSLGINVNLAYSILYILFNIPMFIIAFKYIGKVFAILTFSNVILSSFIISLINPEIWSFLNVAEMQDLPRSLFAGVCTGLAIGFALKGNFSTGGTDVLSLALSIKKGVGIGKYQMMFNGLIMLLGGILSEEWTAILYTLVYIGTSSYVVDLIHTRNRKVKLEVISTMGQEICDVLLRESHHGITIIDGVGAYTKEKKNILHIVVSTYQLTEIVAIVKNIDPTSFIVQIPVNNIYGRFYIPPFK